jgi:hypothetical protein
MPTPSEIESLSRRVAELVYNDRKDDAIALVWDDPNIFPPLPESVRDDRQFVLAVMGRHLQYGTYASSGLKQDIEFFVEAFNLYFPRPPISFTSVHDLVFILEFAKKYFHYWHDITESNVLSRFSCSKDQATEDVRRGKYLIDLTENYKKWMTGNKEDDIAHLKNTCPGFADYAYEYSFMWAYGNCRRDSIDHIW